MYSPAACACIVRAAPAKKRRLSAATGSSSDFTSSSGLPTFSDSSCASSSACSSTASASRSSARARSPGVVEDQPGNASFAARTAASTSSGPDFGAVAISSSVAGLRIGSVPCWASEGSSPPTKFLICVAVVAIGLLSSCRRCLWAEDLLDRREGHADALRDGGVRDLPGGDVHAASQPWVALDRPAHPELGEREHVRQRRVRERVRRGDRYRAGHVGYA